MRELGGALGGVAHGTTTVVVHLVRVRGLDLVCRGLQEPAQPLRPSLPSPPALALRRAVRLALALATSSVTIALWRRVKA